MQETLPLHPWYIRSVSFTIFLKIKQKWADGWEFYAVRNVLANSNWLASGSMELHDLPFSP